ncbi:MAG TPA: DUF2007 domain-containing protein [Acidimicrobiia bacterium]
MGSTPRSPRPGGRIVEVANYPSRFEAGAALDLLHDSGIQAMGKFGDAEGWAPHFALVDGFRVCVFEDDLDDARAILDAAGSDGALPSRN